MSLNIIPLTLLKAGHKSQFDPKIKYFPFDKIEDYDVGIDHGTKLTFNGMYYEVAETPEEVMAANDMNSTDPELVKAIDLAASGNLAVQATGTAIAKYLTEFTTVTSTTAEAATLDAATVGKARRVINNDADTALLLFPASGEFHLGVAVDLALSVPAGTSVALYCEVAGTWKIVL